MTDWDAQQYLKFAHERTQPSIDLVNRLAGENVAKIVDIGCGPGNSTAVLHQRFPDADILGVDNSPAMIERARREYPQMRFALCDVSTEADTLDTDFDVVFSNACIQWVPDHPTLLPALVRRLRPGGVFAVQVPFHDRLHVHRLVAEVVARPRWAPFFDGRPFFFTMAQGDYYDILSELSDQVTMWQTTYFHVMKSPDDIMEWYRGTGLRPYLDQLPAVDRPEFEQEVARDIAAAYPRQRNGDILFLFPRFFFMAVARAG